LKDIINFIKDYVKKSRVIKQEELIKEVKKIEKVDPSKKQLFEYLQVVDSALYHSSPQYRLKKTQLIALVLFLQTSKKNLL